MRYEAAKKLILEKVSDRILREFYGLPEPAAAVQPAPPESKPPERKRKIVSMMDFL